MEYHIEEEPTMNINIEETQETQEIPLDLLLLADPCEEMINQYLHTGICFIAKDSDKIVGVLIMLKTRPMTMEIMNIAVREEFQNKGIGRQLINKAIEKAKRENIRILEIGTGNPGVIQMLLYQKCGFRIVGVDFDYFRIHYKEKMVENGIEIRDMIRLKMEL